MKSLLSMARFQDVGPTAEVATLEKAADRRVATIETVDGFTYVITLAPKAKTDKPDAAKPEDGPPPQEDAYNMAVKVTATLAKERTKAADEKPEDAKSKDEEFQTKIKALEAKLKTEQFFQSNVFEVSKYTIDSLLKSRAEWLSKPADNAGPQAPPPALTPLPSGSVEAVTPPISIEQ
jgi:predicted nucleotide-binding protein